MSIASSLKVSGIKIGNASDEDITVLFDSQEKIFPAGEVIELDGHIDFPRNAGGAIKPSGAPAKDAFGRDLPSSNTPIPKVGAGSVDVATFCLERAGALGLYHFTGDIATDSVAAKQAREIGTRTRIDQHQKTLAEWRQTCAKAAAQGLSVPPMPLHVARADEFLLNNSRKALEAVKRFQVKLDGASYDTLEDAKEHIFKRPHYVEYRTNWQAQVIDRFGEDPEVKEEKPKTEAKAKK